MSRRSLIRALVPGILVLLPGCLALPPEHSLRAEHGTVWAEDTAGARVVGELLDDLTPRVRALLPDTRDEQVEIWVQRELAVYSGWPVDREVPAFTIDGTGRIHMLEAERPDLSAALAHELVHSLLGPSWAVLPPVVEEGLADWIQENVHDDEAATMRADHLAKASAAFGGLRFGIWTARASRRLASFTYLGPGAEQGEVLDPVAALSGGPSPGRGGGWRPYEVSVSDPRLYGVGYLVVARIIDRSGMDGLHGLCRRAESVGRDRIPVSWLLDAAGLDRDPETWRRAVLERIGPEELTALGASLSGFLAEMLAQNLGRYTTAHTGAEFLERIRPRLGLVGGGPRVPLGRVPRLLDQLERMWPERPRSRWSRRR